MRNALSLLFAALMLAGCVTPEQEAEYRRIRIEKAKTNCIDYGFTPDTTPMAECIQREINNEDVKRRISDAEDAARDAELAAMRANMPRETRCENIGGITSCSTY